MKLKINHLCRGRGAVYIDLALEGCNSSTVEFGAGLSNGAKLPAMVFKRKEEGSTVTCVLVAPLYEKHKLVITASADGGAKTAQKTLSWDYVKWLSRYTYRFKGAAAADIRDIEKVAFSHQLHIEAHMAAVSPSDTYLVKGTADAPNDESELTFSLLDEDGHVVSDPNLYTGRRRTTMLKGYKRQEVPFTLRLPNDTTTRCLVAESTSGSQLGFLCFDGPSRAFYLEDKPPFFYRSERPTVYPGIVHERAKFLELVDPADYQLEGGPCFSIVVPLYKTPLKYLHELIDSITGQIYQNWELVLVNASPEVAELKQDLAHLSNARIKVVELLENLGISENTNAGIEVATGDYVVFCDHDDVLDPFALYEYAKRAIKDLTIDAFYSDEDFITPEGAYVNPGYKSDFNIDLLRCHNYITHLLAARTSLAKELKLSKEADGAQDYDFVLRLSEKTSNIVHVDEILYHWRMSETSTANDPSNKLYAQEAGLKALQAHLDRMGLNATAENSGYPFVYRTVYHVEGTPKVSIIIPNKDNVDVLSRCLNSLYEKTEYKNFEVVIVENNSTEQVTFDYYKRAEQHFENLKVLYWLGEFNFSKINNFGFEQCSGDYILMLNNDIEIIEGSWLSSMLGFCQREDVGAVGAKLLYPDNTIQHAGVAMVYCPHGGVMGGPAHMFYDLDNEDPCYLNRAIHAQDVLICTGACLLVKRAVYEQLGGLSERYAVAYNDVDFCLRINELGLHVVYDAQAVLYHHESVSRGYDTESKNVVRFSREQGMLRADWAKYYVSGDPYYSKHML